MTYVPAQPRDIVYIDFETESILPRPEYPPKPVGVAILYPGQEPMYLAWGHPTQNNCDRAAAKTSLGALWESASRRGVTLGFYNAKFDLEVARVHFGLELPPPSQVDDALILAVLKDPRRFNYRLKELAKTWLGADVSERDELKAWVLENCREEVGRKKSKWAAFISKAPGDLVGKYACADVRLTRDMREYLHDTALSMPEPYYRELRLLPVLLSMESRGVPIDVEQLEYDYKIYSEALERLDDEIRTHIGLAPGTTLDGDEFANAIQRFGTPGQGWPRTAKGAPSTAAESLDLVLADRGLFGALQYRGILSHSLSTFMSPWRERSVKGRFHAQWNALKGEERFGAETGRLSSSPNLQNIITEDNCEKADKERPEDYPTLPRLRRYIAAPPDKIIIGRDFNQQEYRVFAHYENDKLCAAYKADPWMDIHVFVMELLNRMANVGLERKPTKTLNFGMLYGMGAKKLSVKIKKDLDFTYGVIEAYMNAFPGIKTMRDQMDLFDKTKQPIMTLGGRIYYAEEPKIIEGRLRRWGYKLVNLLCQASSADLTKEAMIAYHDSALKGKLILSVHDELAVEVNEGPEAQEEMGILKASMEENALSKALDVPLLSEGYYGPNFQDTEDLPKGQ